MGLKSADPFVFLSHQVNKARQSLEKWSKSNGKNKKGLQYLDAGPLEDKKVKKELNEFKVTCEHMLGETIDSDTWKDACDNNLSKKSRLYLMLNRLKGSTVFLKDSKGFPYFQEYGIKGSLKDFGQIYCQRQGLKKYTFLRSMDYTASMFNRHIWPYSAETNNDKIYFYLNETCKGKKQKVEDQTLERSMRAETAQGKRITLAKSEVVPSGCYLKFNLVSYLSESIFNAEIIKRPFKHRRGLWMESMEDGRAW